MSLLPIIGKDWHNVDNIQMPMECQVRSAFARILERHWARRASLDSQMETSEERYRMQSVLLSILSATIVHHLLRNWSSRSGRPLKLIDEGPNLLFLWCRTLDNVQTQHLP